MGSDIANAIAPGHKSHQVCAALRNSGGVENLTENETKATEIQLHTHSYVAIAGLLHEYNLVLNCVCV